MLMLIIAAYVFIPISLIALAQRIKMLDQIGVVVLAFVAGIGFAASVDLSSVLGAQNNARLQQNFSEISIALALPLLVFAVDIKTALQLAGSTIKAMLLMVLAVCFSSAIGAWIFADKLEHIWQTAGMAVGAYIGGGPNIAAIKTAINAEPRIFNDIFSYDILLSSIFLFAIMSIGKPVFKLFLPAFTQSSKIAPSDAQSYAHIANETAAAYRVLLAPQLIGKNVLALLLAGLCVALALGLSSLLPRSMQAAGSIILISSLGMLASFVPFIRNLKNSFQLGMFLIVIFCFSAGSMADLAIIQNLNIYLFGYIGFIMLGATLLHAILCRCFKVDVDTFLITATAAIMSVPFIPVVASAIKNQQVLIPGFAVAIIGYILGNYLGIGMAYFIKYLLAC